jgi:TPR repeat protein
MSLMHESPLRFPFHPSLVVLVLSLQLCGCASSHQKQDPVQQVKLGNRYYQGKWVAKNNETAVLWYRKAALQGNADGQFYLGRCYSRGDGVPKNEVDAAQWYLKAAEQGCTEAQYRLGLCYDRNEGVPQNNVTAYKWLNIAASSGYEDARAARNAVACRMTEAQVTQAQKLSQDWQPK